MEPIIGTMKNLPATLDNVTKALFRQQVIECIDPRVCAIASFERQEVNPDPPKPPKKKKAAPQGWGGVKKEKVVEGRGTGEGKPQGGEGKEGGGGAAPGPPAWVPYPQGVEKGEVVGNVKGGRQKLVWFGNGETLYKVPLVHARTPNFVLV